MRDEVILTLQTYLAEANNSVHYYGQSDEVRLLQHFVSKGKITSFDSPDAFILDNGNYLIIEHFEFTCYRNRGKKGDSQREEQARIERLDCEPNYCETLDIISSGTYYANNSINIFNKHWQRISHYKDSIYNSTNDANVYNAKVCFLINDASLLESCYYDELSHRILGADLAHCHEFIVNMQSHNQVDWVLTGSNKSSKESPVWFISQKYIQDYISKAIKYTDHKFLWSNPKAVKGQITIPIKPD